MDKFTSMKVFVTVVQAGSFSAAAEALTLSKAMVSKHIKHLEDTLGARLLNRTNRSLSLTEGGVTYLEQCQQILVQVEEADLAIAQLNAQPQGTIKVTAPTSFGTFHLVPAIVDYKAQYPEVRVHLALNDRPVDLVGEGLDLGVRVGRLRDSNFIARQFASVRRVVCGASAYFERHGVPQVPADLIDHNCLLYTQQTPKDKWKFKGPEGDLLVSVAGDFEAMVGDAVRMAAIHGLGLIQLATHVVGQDLKAGRLRAVLTEYEPDEVPIYAVYPHRRHLSSTVRTFVEFLHARFQPKPDWVRGR